MLMVDFILWFLLITLVGWVTFPIVFKLFPRLADRGYGLARIAGLLLWTYFFWLLTILQVGQNNLAGSLLALSIVLIISVLCLRKQTFREWLTWIKGNFRVILFEELVFLVLFAFCALLRATYPDLTGTEKPMELAFINAILRSPEFPPRDPWLSGYAISYYYFGYVMVANLIRVTGVASWIGFNLAISLWFALTGISASSLLFSLISRIRPGEENSSQKTGTNLLWSLLGPLFVLVVSNIEGFFELLHARGVFWYKTADGQLTSRFWTWLDIQEISLPPVQPFGWVPERLTGIWWWRASRVLQDYTASGVSKEVIDEFPFFSFLLADLHPHVLAMPVAILAIAAVYHLFLSIPEDWQDGIPLITWVRKWIKNEPISISNMDLSRFFRSPYFGVLAFLGGSLAFLNTWDFPIYVGLFAAVYTYKRYQVCGWNWNRVEDFLSLALTTGITGVLLFFPFYIGFSSQAGGFLPSLFFFTRGIHLWVMFLPFLFPIFFWLFRKIFKKREQPGSIRNGIVFTLLIFGGLFALSYLFGAIAISLPFLGQLDTSSGLGALLTNLGNLFYGVQGITQPGELWDSLLLRLTMPGAWITLAFLTLLVWSLLTKNENNEREVVLQNSGAPHSGSPDAFILIVVLLGAGLVIFPEFFYLRDQFGWRINTIFKFYFQAWILWAISAAFASVYLWKTVKRLPRFLFGVLWCSILLMGLAYPFFGVRMKFSGLNFQNFSLNGARHIEINSPDEMKAINWLVQAPDGVILEAVGGSYTGYARISTYTGLPTVLGWPGHESQWRGGYQEMGSRETDVRQIYQSTDWYQTLELLRQYHIRYVYIGSIEENTYRVSREKFEANLDPVFSSGNVIIYEIPDELLRSE